jgi:hypothetical protein
LTPNFFKYCFPANKSSLEWQNGTTKPTWNGKDDVVGWGLVLSPNNQLAITGNGILMGADYLYSILILEAYANVPLQTNFGDDRAKPFKYDIVKWPGLGLD